MKKACTIDNSVTFFFFIYSLSGAGNMLTYLQHVKDNAVWSADRILKRLKGQTEL